MTKFSKHQKGNNMSDDFQKRIVFYNHPKKQQGNDLILAFFALSSLFSVLAFFIALLALIK